MTSGKVHDATESTLTTDRFDNLVAAFSSISDPETMALLLKDICTTAELDAMGQRLQVAALVNEGVSYQEISRRTGASTATVTRVAHWLKYGEGGYNAVLGGTK